MTLKLTAIALAMLATGSIVTADLNVTMHHDATYAINSYRGPICSGAGDRPTGRECPLKGDVAIADCHSDLPTYNGTDCIAPVDAKCVLAESKWSCVFPMEDLTSTLIISRDSSLEKSPWGNLPWRAPPPADPATTISTETAVATTE